MDLLSAQKAFPAFKSHLLFHVDQQMNSLNMGSISNDEINIFISCPFFTLSHRNGNLRKPEETSHAERP